MSKIKPGNAAPQFTLKDTNETEVSLNDRNGKWVVLYFYPKDNTSGCTVEAVDFTTRIKEFEKLNTVILGVSPVVAAAINSILLILIAIGIWAIWKGAIS